MKIVHVISCLTKGGGERIVAELANEAVKQGDEVAIIAAWPEDPVHLQDKIHPNVNIKFVASQKLYAYLKIPYWILTNRKWIAGYDVLHCHLTFGGVFGSVANIILKKIFRKRNPVIVETYHAVGMSIPKINRWIHSRMALLRDGLVLMAKDPYWNHFLLKHPNLKTEVIPNGVSVLIPQKNTALQQKFYKELGIRDNCKYLVGTVGMLRPDRRPRSYIPIFRHIHGVLGNEVHFILAGGGIEFNKIKKLIEEEGLSDYVHMPGLVNNPTTTITNLDIYVSVSVGKTTGVSMIEAAMCKIPVVGIQLIDNYKAKNEDWVWSHTDTTEVAKKIIFLLQNVEERDKLATNQNNYVNQHFTSAAMYTSYDLFYKKVLAQ